MLTMVEAKLESMELPFANSAALEATTQRCSALAHSLQLTSMYVARGHHAGLERACGPINAVATLFQRS
jgi:hypothetical protein